MEKLFKMTSPASLLTLVFCLFFAAEIFAQQKSEPSFAVGLAPFSLLLPSGKVNVRGEWAYASNKSLSLLVAIPRPTPAPNLLGNQFDLEDDASTSVNRFTSFGTTLEHRFYLGQNAPRGFYFAPYSRYNSFSLERTSQNTENQYKTTVKGSLGGFGFGLAAGVQFRLGDFLTMDATLAGVDFKWMNARFDYSTTDPEADLSAFRDKVEETVGDIPLIGSKFDITIEDNTVKAKTPGVVLPGYRFNLTVNYIF
ncbi:MAG: hypothetical protein OHK0019_38080 [Saprospiraceae bacterium]